jgi:hypothetical protein
VLNWNQLEDPMRNPIATLGIFVLALFALSSTARAQVYFPASGAHRDPASAAAEKTAPIPPYDPHDLSGIWIGRGPALLSDKQAPPFTPLGQKMFDANKPSQYGRGNTLSTHHYIPTQGNDPLAKCDPLGYPRNLGGGPFEMVQTPGKIVQIFEEGRRVREIWTDGRKLPDDLDPRWYGWAVGHWEGDTLVVESTGYDERAWVDTNGYPHSDQMKMVERYSHPDATTLQISMTLQDPKVYTKPWSGQKTFKMELPKGLTVLSEWYCVPSEEESFNENVRDKAAGLDDNK